MTSYIFDVHPGLVFKAVDTAILLKSHLDTLEEMSVNCLLWKAIHKLSIIQNLLPAPRETWSQNYLSLPLRLTSLQRITLPEDQEPDHVLLLKQVQKCRFFLQNVLEETIYELSYQGSCYFLEYVLCCDNLFNYDNIILKQGDIDLNKVIRSLKSKLVIVRENCAKTLLYFSEMTGPCLENSVVNAVAQAETVIMRTEAKQQARVYQNQYRVREKVNSVLKDLESINQDITEENEISNEIDNHLMFMTSNLQRNLDSWTLRYNNEIESLDIALLQLRSKLDELKDQHEKLSQQYMEHKEHYEILREEADIRDREMELKRIRTKAATVIQEWWRRIKFKRFLKIASINRKKAGKMDKKTKKTANKKKKRK